MKNNKELNVDIIKTIIEIWGDVNVSDLNLKAPIKVNLIGHDKYCVSLEITKLLYDYVLVASYTNGNNIGEEKIDYYDLPANTIKKILEALIKYDEMMMNN